MSDTVRSCQAREPASYTSYLGIGRARRLKQDKPLYTTHGSERAVCRSGIKNHAPSKQASGSFENSGPVDKGSSCAKWESSRSLRVLPSWRSQYYVDVQFHLKYHHMSVRYFWEMRKSFNSQVLLRREAHWQDH